MTSRDGCTPNGGLLEKDSETLNSPDRYRIWMNNSGIICAHFISKIHFAFEKISEYNKRYHGNSL